MSLREIVDGQRKFFRSGKTRELTWRREKLARLEAVLVEKKDAILESLAADLGKPGMEAFLCEYYFLLEEVRLVRKKMKGWLKRKRVGSPFYFQPARSWIERHPFGVVLIMAPWNYPFQLSLSPLIAAIAAGNSVVLKPSEMASHSERLIAEIVAEVFANDGAAVVTGGVEVAKGLLEDKFDFIFFTGSTAVGRQVAEIAGRALTPALLELGGKCPCVVSRKADLTLTARRVVAGKFLNAGQTCFAPDFVLVEAAVEKEFLQCLREVLEEVPWDEEMACVISGKHFERLESLCEGRLEQFGKDEAERRYLAPRLVSGVDWEHPAMKEEIFGPVLPVKVFQDEDELMGDLGKLESCLAVYCFSKDAEFVEKVAGGLPSGSLCVNDTMKQLSQLKLPLGGVGPSGHGRYRGRHGVEAFSYEKSVTKRYFVGKDLMELMPPYEKAYRWIKKFMR